MLIRTWLVDGIVVVEVSGRLCAESESALSDSVRDAVHRRRYRLVVNLVDVSRIDAAGLGELVRSFRMACVAGGEVKLVVRSTAVRDLLARTHLLPLFPAYDTEAAALASFEAAPLARAVDATATRR